MGVSVTFVGLVFTSWGNNVGDLTTTIVSAKSKMAGQATSSLFGSQIINIQISLGVPWLVKNLIYGPVKLNDPNIPSSIEAIICVLFAMYLILVLGKMRLSYCNGLLILIVYFLYVFYEINQNWGDPAALGKSRGRIPGNSRGRRPHQKNPTLHLQN
jgi:Ca2+/Na+ antiporter